MDGARRGSTCARRAPPTRSRPAATRRVASSVEMESTRRSTRSTATCTATPSATGPDRWRARPNRSRRARRRRRSSRERRELGQPRRTRVAALRHVRICDALPRLQRCCHARQRHCLVGPALSRVCRGARRSRRSPLPDSLTTRRARRRRWSSAARNRRGAGQVRRRAARSMPCPGIAAVGSVVRRRHRWCGECPCARAAAPPETGRAHGAADHLAHATRLVSITIPSRPPKPPAEAVRALFAQRSSPALGSRGTPSILPGAASSRIPAVARRHARRHAAGEAEQPRPGPEPAEHLHAERDPLRRFASFDPFGAQAQHTCGVDAHRTLPGRRHSVLACGRLVERAGCGQAGRAPSRPVRSRRCRRRGRRFADRRGRHRRTRAQRNQYTISASSPAPCCDRCRR